MVAQEDPRRGEEKSPSPCRGLNDLTPGNEREGERININPLFFLTRATKKKRGAQGLSIHLPKKKKGWELALSIQCRVRHSGKKRSHIQQQRKRRTHSTLQKKLRKDALVHCRRRRGTPASAMYFREKKGRSPDSKKGNEARCSLRQIPSIASKKEGSLMNRLEKEERSDYFLSVPIAGRQGGARVDKKNLKEKGKKGRAAASAPISTLARCCRGVKDERSASQDRRGGKKGAFVERPPNASLPPRGNRRVRKRALSPSGEKKKE